MIGEPAVNDLTRLITTARNHARIDRWNGGCVRADALDEMAQYLEKILLTHGLISQPVYPYGLGVRISYAPRMYFQLAIY